MGRSCSTEALSTPTRWSSGRPIGTASYALPGSPPVAGSRTFGEPPPHPQATKLNQPVPRTGLSRNATACGRPDSWESVHVPQSDSTEPTEPEYELAFNDGEAASLGVDKQSFRVGKAVEE